MTAVTGDDGDHPILNPVSRIIKVYPWLTDIHMEQEHSRDRSLYPE